MHFTFFPTDKQGEIAWCTPKRINWTDCSSMDLCGNSERYKLGCGSYKWIKKNAKKPWQIRWPRFVPALTAALGNEIGFFPLASPLWQLLSDRENGRNNQPTDFHKFSVRKRRKFRQWMAAFSTVANTLFPPSEKKCENPPFFEFEREGKKSFIAAERHRYYSRTYVV